MGKSLDVYSESHEKLLLVGYFNAEEKESCLNMFLYQHGLANIVIQGTCFKNPSKPSCIDLFLTSNPRSFRNTTAVSTGLSCFQELIANYITKTKPKEITYRNYNFFNKLNFKENLRSNLEQGNCDSNYQKFKHIFMSTLDKHAPLKKKMLRANHTPYMTEGLRKAMMN